MATSLVAQEVKDKTIIMMDTIFMCCITIMLPLMIKLYPNMMISTGDSNNRKTSVLFLKYQIKFFIKLNWVILRLDLEILHHLE